MWKQLAAAVSAALVIAGAPITGQALAEDTADAPRVLIVGDSITQGYKGDYTWRYFLSRALADASVPVDLVGRRTGVFNYERDPDWDYDGPDAYADPAFDQDHGASYGGRLSEAGNFLYDPIGPQVSAQQPDIVIGFWGVNDLEAGGLEASELVDLYRDWVADARAVDPDVDLVIGRLPSTWIPKVSDFNSLVGTLPAELDTPQSRVVVATMDVSYEKGVDTTDDKHPSVLGQRKIAHMMLQALGEASPALAGAPAVPMPPAPVVQPPVVPPETVVITQVPSGPTEATRPGRPRRVKAARRGEARQVTVSWRRARDADRYQVQCGRAARVSKRLTVKVRSGAARCKVRAVGAGGRSPWVRVRVRAARVR